MSCRLLCSISVATLKTYHFLILAQRFVVYWREFLDCHIKYNIFLFVKCGLLRANFTTLFCVLSNFLHAWFNGSQFLPTFISPVKRPARYSFLRHLHYLIEFILHHKMIRKWKEFLLYRHFRNSELKFYENATEGKVVEKLLFHKRKACIIK
jgi:hypothetical protein